MTSLLFQNDAAGIAVGYSSVLPGRLRLRSRILRLRRKIPSWTGLALLVLVANAILAIAAWSAVAVVLR